MSLVEFEPPRVKPYRRPHGEFWTEERREILTEMWERGCSGTEIAPVLGCTRSAVCGKAHRMELEHGKYAPVVACGTMLVDPDVLDDDRYFFDWSAPKPIRHGAFWTDDRLEVLKEMWEWGRPASVIARKLGCTRSAVCGKARRMGYKHGCPELNRSGKYSDVSYIRAAAAVA